MVTDKSCGFKMKYDLLILKMAQNVSNFSKTVNKQSKFKDANHAKNPRGDNAQRET